VKIRAPRQWHAQLCRIMKFSAHLNRLLGSTSTLYLYANMYISSLDWRSCCSSPPRQNRTPPRVETASWCARTQTELRLGGQRLPAANAKPNFRRVEKVHSFKEISHPEHASWNACEDKKRVMMIY